MQRLVTTLLLSGFFLGLGCRDEDGGHTCFPGNEGCPCIGEVCLAGLECVADVCEVIGDTTEVDTDDAGATSPTSE